MPLFWVSLFLTQPRTLHGYSFFISVSLIMTQRAAYFDSVINIALQTLNDIILIDLGKIVEI
jgi:hypothetical protein